MTKKTRNFRDAYLQQSVDRLKQDNYFRGNIEVYCSVFGCGRVLSATEKLFGDKCIHCVDKQQKKPPK